MGVQKVVKNHPNIYADPTPSPQSPPHPRRQKRRLYGQGSCPCILWSHLHNNELLPKQFTFTGFHMNALIPRNHECFGGHCSRPNVQVRTLDNPAIIATHLWIMWKCQRIHIINMVLCKWILCFQQLQKQKSPHSNFKRLNFLQTPYQLIRRWPNLINNIFQCTNHLRVY
jgi:hypothetical protein